MPRYIVSARYKKSTLEVETWAHKKDFNKSFTKEVGWRSGSFKVTMSKDEFEEIPKEDEEAKFYPYFYDESELVSTWDGCWEDFDFSEGTISEEEQEQIKAAWEEENYEGIENLGYQQVETDIILIGPLDFELDDDQPEEDEGNDSEEDGSETNSFTTLAPTLKNLE